MEDQQQGMTIMDRVITDSNLSLAQFRLMQLISPSLPIGSFTYSQGIEWAVEAGWISTKDHLSQWMVEQVQTTLAKLDLPILLRLYDASKTQNLEALSYWSDYLIASRETSELRAEELNRARAFARLLQSLDLPGEPAWFEVLNQCQSAGFAHAARVWEIPKENMLQGFAWSWLENLILAGVKIIPLGQSDGQRLLHDISPTLAGAVSSALNLSDDDIGASNPALSIASSQHQFQYTRLFRS